jgi:N-acetyl sugar amidotransferase
VQRLWTDEVERRVRDAGENRDKQTTPKKVVFCKRCVVSNQRPRIEFNEEGVCNACTYAETKWDRDWTERDHELNRVLEQYGSGGDYNVIVPASGGKDSMFVALKLRELRMRVLCACWAPHLYTDIGRRNFETMNDHFDVMQCWPNRTLHRKLSRLALEFYGDNFLPFIFGQLAYPMRLAAERGTRLVFFGENGEAEYGGDPAANEKPCWDAEHWDRIYQKGASIDDLMEIGRELGAITKEEKACSYYRLPRREALEEMGVQFHWLGYYLPWHPMDNYYKAVDAGFEPNEERSEGTYTKMSSLDDATDGLHYYLAYMKFGLGRCTSDAAQQVRAGDIERDEAVALVRRYDGEWPYMSVLSSLPYLNVDLDHMQTIADRFRAPHLWEDLGEDGYRLKTAVYT